MGRGGSGRTGCSYIRPILFDFGCVGSGAPFYWNIPQLTSLGGPSCRGWCCRGRGQLWTRVAGAWGGGGEGSHALLPEASGAVVTWRQAPAASPRLCLWPGICMEHLQQASLLGSASRPASWGRRGCLNLKGRTKKLQRNQGDGEGKPGLSLGWASVSQAS